MNRKIFYCILPLVFISGSNKPALPNIIFILVDDLGWADVKCNNPESFYETPNIDKLAENGVRFTQAYSAHPVCSPTRAALMTGKHPNRVNITDWIPGNNPQNRPLKGPSIRNELAMEEITIAEKLKDKGYATCFAGKWHLGNDSKYWPEHQGFDINIGGWGAGQPQLRAGVSNGYYSPYGNPRLKDGPEGEYLTNRLTDESIRFITENKDNPFFLYLSFYSVHTPIQPSEKHINKFIKKREHLKQDEVLYQKEGEGWTKLVQDNATYASMIAAVDENVGRITASLKKNGLDKNTWIFLTSDNGGRSTLFQKNAETSNKPLRAGKGWCYEGGIRVALIISGPEVANPGRTAIQPVISMDFFTTILTLAKTEHNNHDGKSLLPVLYDNGTVDRNMLFWHYPHYHGSAWKPGSAIRKDNWKMVYFYEDNHAELYDLMKDPGETNNLIHKFPSIASELEKELFGFLKESNGKFPQPNPDFKNN